MSRNKGLLHNVPIAAGALALAVAAPVSLAEGDNDDEIPFSEAELFFELNNTDGDLGIHASIDGEGWKKLQIEDPSELKILDISVTGRLEKQGLTQLFFESAEPQFEELSPEVFFQRFPEGEYDIEGMTLDGRELESEAELTHVMPAPPVVKVNGSDAAEDCDAELPVVSAPVTISWDPVTESHPDPNGGGAGVQPPVPVTIHNYEVVAEIAGTPYKLSTILPPETTFFQVPSELLDLRDEENNEVKFEVLVRETSYNQTAIESCFEVQ